MPVFMSLFGIGMMLLFSDVLYILVRCLMLTLSGPVVVFALFYCRLDLCCGEC